MWLVGGGGHCNTHYVASSEDLPLSLFLCAIALVGAAACWALLTGRTRTSPGARVMWAAFTGLMAAGLLVAGIAGLLGILHFKCAT